MKKFVSLFLVVLFAIGLVGCDEETPKDEYDVDYADAESFENALNAGESVNGKLVQFKVNEYAPNSILGINCHAGEHLNFLFEEEVDAEQGDVLIVSVKEEPSKVFLTNSWKIYCDLIAINGETVNEITTTSTTVTAQTTTTTTTTTNTTTTTTTTTEPRTLFYSTNDYESAKKGNAGVFSYKNKTGDYDVYWIIDIDERYIYWFTDGNGEETCDKVKIVSGSLNDSMKVTWHDSGEQWSWNLHFKYKNFPETLVVNDHNGIATEFTTTDLDDALSIRDKKTIKLY